MMTRARERQRASNSHIGRRMAVRRLRSAKRRRQRASGADYTTLRRISPIASSRPDSAAVRTTTDRTDGGLPLVSRLNPNHRPMTTWATAAPVVPGAIARP